MTPGARGFAVLEAVVALGLAGVAVAALAASAAAGVRHVRLARERAVALALAADRLEALRAGPRGDGGDETDRDGTTYVRRWRSAGGRGRVARVRVEVVWAGGSIALDGGAFP